MFSAQILVLIATLAVLIGAGMLEYWLLSRSRSKIRLRIHVNGTRGKSSVTRLVASALREAGIRTFAKTTGTLPRMIYPDGSELPVQRMTKANIIEQRTTINQAAAEGAEALVLECMALQPLLQSIAELRIVQSTHTVITNARPDHLDVMGPDARAVTLALCGMVARKGVVLTAERENIDVIEDACKDRKSKLIAVTERDVRGISKAELQPFRYTEHAENVALSLAVCASIGIPRDVALRGMHKTSPDPGALTAHRLDFFGKRLLFYNGFAANDPVSTGRLWQYALDESAEYKTKIAVFNCRSDRADRSVQLAEALCEWSPPHWAVVMGSGTQIFARFATKFGFDASRIVFVEGLGVEEIFERLIELGGSSAMLMGMGNIGGQGLDVVRYFRNRETLPETG